MDDHHISKRGKKIIEFVGVFVAVHLNISFCLGSIFRCSSSKTNPVYGRRVNSLLLVCSLSSHRYSYILFIFDSRFIDS
jgi:hypothetical protein